MMEHMHGMMEQMQGMMGGRSRMSRRGSMGMRSQAEEHEEGGSAAPYEGSPGDDGPWRHDSAPPRAAGSTA